MPMAFVAAYSQRFGFKIGDDPISINVGPTIPLPMFKQLPEARIYNLSVRKTGRQLRRRLYNGGLRCRGSFPNPSGPLMPYQVAI